MGSTEMLKSSSSSARYVLDNFGKYIYVYFTYYLVFSHFVPILVSTHCRCITNKN